MLRKFLKRLRSAAVEVTAPSGHRQVMSHDEYVSKVIADQRERAERMRLGIAPWRDLSSEHVLRRWLM